jgi:2,3-bisphosphoglycerate-independent phosphoglycerate mutase
MKGILVILDGLGDLPNKQLHNQTPLEAADMPNLNFLANRGDLGYMYPVKPNFIAESDEAVVSIFGNELISSTRGQLETAGTDIKLTRGDLALRINFATIDSLKNKNVINRRAGRTLTTSEAEEFAKAINKIKISCGFTLEPTIQHRGVLVLYGGFSDNISSNDVPTKLRNVTNKIQPVKALDDDENSQYTANTLNELLEKIYEVLENHPLNEKRKKKGLLPVNYILIRGAGAEPLKLKFYRKWLSVSYMPLEVGFSRISGMKVFSFNYPRLKKLDVYANLHDGLRKACKLSVKTIKRNYNKFDYAYIHIKETDLPGHDNKPLEKKAMLEYIDKNLFSFLRKFAVKNKIKIVVTGDHSTPCKLKSHSSDPVPVMFYSADDRGPKEKNFNEKESKRGALGRIVGKDLLRRVGFV